MGVAKFEKVSMRQFKDDLAKVKTEEISEDYLDDTYNAISLPYRKTIGSAGYDIISPIDFVLGPGEWINVPTGIRCKIDPNWVLKIYMRSGLGFKYGLRLANGTGIIDSDYYGSSNEGHIHIKLINDSSIRKDVVVHRGDGIAQGLFIPFGLTVDDNASGIRDGGFGSTDSVKGKME